jgi:hypothetical protein
MLNVIYDECYLLRLNKPFMECVVILNVAMLSVVMLNVVAPKKSYN